MDRSGYIAGQLLTAAVALAIAAAVALLAVSLGIVAVRMALYLITEHPLVAIASALAGVLLVGRKL